MSNRVRIAVVLGCLGLAGPLAAQTVTEFPIPTAGSAPQDIAAGPDGNLWFTEQNANRIGRITTEGAITEFTAPALGPLFIAAGADGNLWFTQRDANQIGRMTPAGVITEFTVPGGSSLFAISAGPDGNLWFTDPSANQIGRMTTAGVVTQFSIPTTGCVPIGIAAGPDGNLWFAEQNANKIGLITPTGVITEFSLPTAGRLPQFIVAGPDGNLWFTEGVAQIGRITTAGVVTEFSTPNIAFRIGSGPDGNLWFTEGNKIGRITTAGLVTEFPIPTAISGSAGITAGPDGALWFTEQFSNQIGRITTGSCVANDTTLCLSNSRFRVTADFETQDGHNGAAHAQTLTGNTGYFWFFDPSNVEVVTKVLPFCADPFNSIWIFAAGLTNVKVDLTYTDTDKGAVVTKKNDLGVPFAPIQDTQAFKTCP